MRRTTEELAKAKAGEVTTESVDVLFAPRKIRPRGIGKYYRDHWRGMTRLIVASTGRIVGIFENPNDARRIEDALNMQTHNANVCGLPHGKESK